MKRKRRIGLVLGSGSARGWAHIGVIRALVEAGVQPDIVCGSSIGALVGAIYADGKLDWLEGWVRALDWKGVMRLMDPGWRGGLLGGGRLVELMQTQFGERDFSQLAIPLGVVATDLVNGHEIWLREGSVAVAARASFATPGLFTPVWRDGTFLVDGGVVNPVPVSLARAMGAEIVFAVDLGSDYMRRRALQPDDSAAGNGTRNWMSRLLFRQNAEPAGAEESAIPRSPSMLDVVTGALNIMQVRIARSRLAGEPADVLLAPRLGELGLLEYHRAAECIEEGRSAVERMLPAIRDALLL
jgi:NTE family protein